MHSTHLLSATDRGFPRDGKDHGYHTGKVGARGRGGGREWGLRPTPGARHAGDGELQDPVARVADDTKTYGLKNVGETTRKNHKKNVDGDWWTVRHPRPP